MKANLTGARPQGALSGKQASWAIISPLNARNISGEAWPQLTREHAKQASTAKYRWDLKA